MDLMIKPNQRYTITQALAGGKTQDYTKLGMTLMPHEKELIQGTLLNELTKKGKTIQIWMEGYRATGEHGVAQLLAAYNAEGFHQAMWFYMQDNPGDVTVDERGYTIWACKLYDNATDARKSFG